MKKELTALSNGELQRVRLMGHVESGNITLMEASEKMGVSYRQAKRIWKSYRARMGRAVLRTGTVVDRRTTGCQRMSGARSWSYPKAAMAGFNDSHFTEKLVEREGIVVSRETVRRLRRGTGAPPKRKRRARKHYKRRDRKPQEGLMALWDGSPHRWFGPGNSPCCLMAAIDDATSKVIAARFFPSEGSHGYLWLLDRMVRKHGIPASVYQDRHGSLRRNDDSWTIEEELAGRQFPTHVGMALEALGTRAIFAISPQAKGRVERLFNTLQDRLVAELVFEGITTMDGANKYLDSFIRDHNKRFSVPAGQSEKAWTAPDKGLDVDRTVSFRYDTTVGNDNTVRICGLVIDIPPGPKRRSYAKAKVEVRQLLDGSWRVYRKDIMLAKHPSTAVGETLHPLKHKRNNTKNAYSDGWVYRASAQDVPAGRLPIQH